MSKTRRVSSYQSYNFNESGYTVVKGNVKSKTETERVQMKRLNERFANYTSKVNDLRELNKSLAAENKLLKQTPSTTEVDGSYENELQRLRSTIEELNVENAKLEIARNNLAFDIEEISEKYEQEQQENRDLEKEKQSLIRVIETATEKRFELESKVENQRETMEFQAEVNRREKESLREQIQPMEEIVLQSDPSTVIPDINDAISKMREEYEQFNVKYVDDHEEFYKEKVSTLSQELKISQEDIFNLRSDQNEKIKKIRQLQIEIESLRSGKLTLEGGIKHLENRLGKEEIEHEELIKKLNEDLNFAKEDLSNYLKDYKSLNSVKLSLEQEIAHYRKLLHQEETKHSNKKSPISGNQTMLD